MIELVNSELELMQDRKSRDQLADRVDALEKVKALALLPDGINATIEMAATYYEVNKNTIELLIADHKEELQEDGLSTLRGEELKNFVTVFKTVANIGNMVSPKARSLTIVPRRALLRIGMLLRNSEVAKTVRSYLLNVEEIAREEAPQVVHKAIHRTGRISWASIEKAIRYKTKIGQTLGLTPATAQVLAIELLEQSGLQMRAILGKKDGKEKWEWQVTDKGKPFAKLIPTTVKEGNVEVTKYAIRWFENVLGVINHER